jgi:hypothetical protein
MHQHRGQHGGHQQNWMKRLISEQRPERGRADGAAHPKQRYGRKQEKKGEETVVSRGGMHSAFSIPSLPELR